PRPNLENLLPRTVDANSSPVVPIDVSSIYLHSPDELLEENFEEALREQYSSLPPLDPALDLTLSGGPLDPEKENFDDIAEHGIVGVAGDDMFARQVITIYACRLPSNKTFDYAKFLRVVSCLLAFLRFCSDVYFCLLLTKRTGMRLACSLARSLTCCSTQLQCRGAGHQQQHYAVTQ